MHVHVVSSKGGMVSSVANQVARIVPRDGFDLDQSASRILKPYLLRPDWLWNKPSLLYYCSEKNLLLIFSVK